MYVHGSDEQTDDKMPDNFFFIYIYFFKGLGMLPAGPPGELLPADHGDIRL